jgi:preprotein translocase subunit Sss1
MRDNGALTGFRNNFSHQFEEVTNALPYRMVIVIDDLDRCRAEAILNLMETVNFLVSSGKCIVIFGMATDRVQAALAMSFKQVADDFIRLSETSPVGDTPVAISQNARLAYAGEYLEKLINIKITVPVHRDITLNKLLQNSPVLKRQFHAILRWSFVIVMIITSIALGIYTDFLLDRFISSTSNPREKMFDFTHASFLIGLVIVIIGFVVGVAWYKRSIMRQVKDSVPFQEALKCWINVVKTKSGTPRAIKRFANRIRYLAMLQEGETVDASFLKFLSRSWRKETQSTVRSQAVAEHRLVALGALYEVYGAQWEQEAVKPTSTTVREAIEEYERACNTTWPPSDDELKAFAKALNGIRLAGDVDILSSTQTTRHSSMNSKA